MNFTSFCSVPYPHNCEYECCNVDSDYVRAQNDVSALYGDQRRFTNMSLVNIAKAGLFSADRAVTEYAKNIWHLK